MSQTEKNQKNTKSKKGAATGGAITSREDAQEIAKKEIESHAGPKYTGTLSPYISLYADKVLDAEYKNPDSQRKIRAFLKKLFESMPPIPVTEERAAPVKNVIYSFSSEEIMEILMERGRALNSASIDRYTELLTDATVAPGGFLQYIREDDKRMKTVWDAARFLEFSFEELGTKKGWNWLLKIAVHQEMKKVHSSYDFRFVLSPEKHIEEVADLEDDIQEILMDPQLTLLDDERGAKIEKIRDRITDKQNEWKKRIAACPDIQFEGKVKEVSYRDIKIWDKGEGEAMTIPGTILTIKIPGRTVEELNAVRGAIDEYQVKMLSL